MLTSLGSKIVMSSVFGLTLWATANADAQQDNVVELRNLIGAPVQLAIVSPYRRPLGMCPANAAYRLTSFARETVQICTLDGRELNRVALNRGGIIDIVGKQPPIPNVINPPYGLIVSDPSGTLEPITGGGPNPPVRTGEDGQTEPRKPRRIRRGGGGNVQGSQPQAGTGGFVDQPSGQGRTEGIGTGNGPQPPTSGSGSGPGRTRTTGGGPQPPTRGRAGGV